MGSFLSQEEIDALLGGNTTDSGNAPKSLLSPVEVDVLSEIGNINAGSASTALSELLNQLVLMDTPHLTCTSPFELQKGFAAPYILVEVGYNSGLEGNNVFILQARDAAIIANLMMGGDGTSYDEEMNEITLSAVSEAMNQMIGYSATSMSQVFNRTIEISPPKITLMNVDNEEENLNWNIFSDDIAVISFNLEIGTLLKSEIMLIMNLEVAKQEVEYLIAATSKSKEAETSGSPAAGSEPNKVQIPPQQIMVEDQNGFFNSNNLNLILDIPLKLSVILGRTRRNIAEVLKLTPGSIVELDRLENEPVEVLVNDTLIARGEVVVVKEYFGVRITDIMSTESRIKSLVVK